MNNTQKIAHTLDCYVTSTSANVDDVAASLISRINGGLDIADIALLVDMCIKDSAETNNEFIANEYLVLIGKLKGVML